MVTETRQQMIARVERQIQSEIDQRLAKMGGCGHGTPAAVCSDCGDGGMPGCGCDAPGCLVESLKG